MLRDDDLARCQDALDADRPAYAEVAIDAPAAAALAAAHGLRALDAIHLAAALLIQGESLETEVRFGTFDEHQAEAARATGLFVVT